ncbi:23S rRNA (guanine(745)-N(1))-methyltransferase [Marinobacterium nitratireducens]|uniref:23S rRNA (Guanine(745)-N(1))-methyltransferase n=1 Tax=Marinobacterium nitratireducens TaxID=518897 RepID=A0A917ZP17_9GAMM|nr:methyltransferase domain-containing protein [Marinobacterium nitratireducens]GGO86812.1 23S rRNA (guanine(745)-N(1))-methyltransferase [Marinobacterium nitratireducens]
MTELLCPVCRLPLTQHERQLRCEQGHSFDQARQGYWNLLLVQRKRSRDPGDNAAMVQARRDFLDRGHYAPLSDRINDLVGQALTPGKRSRILDLGCGEGYYSARLAQALHAAGVATDFIGLDISKHAVRAACQRSRAIRWLVASGADLPVAEGSLDAVTLLFSRLMPEPLARAIRPGGLLLLAWPGDDHLIELRRLIYREVRPSGFDPLPQLEGDFQLRSRERVSYPFRLEDSESIRTLLGMTPHSQRMPREAREALEARSDLGLTFDVNLALLERR